MLNLKPLGKEKFFVCFPEVYENCLLRGIDIAQEPVPVFPGAHYSMGGIYVDLHGKTTFLESMQSVNVVATVPMEPTD